MHTARDTEIRGYRELPRERFRVVGSFPDPFYADRRWKWRMIRLLSRNPHRQYVGGSAGGCEDFATACRFQLDFLVGRGLKPDSVLLDLGCGCLRAGIHFVDYLHPDRYLGMDISAEVVYRGIVRELGLTRFHEKRPEFVISDQFSFEAFSRRPQFIMANSLLTHLPPQDIRLCLHRLRRFVGDQRAEFFATFSESLTTSDHAGSGHYLGGTSAMTYRRDEMSGLGRECGWDGEYIGAWGHPKNEREGAFRRQMMFRFVTS
jgi:hypothetical protein